MCLMSGDVVVALRPDCACICIYSWEVLPLLSSFQMTSYTVTICYNLSWAAGIVQMADCDTFVADAQ